MRLFSLSVLFIFLFSCSQKQEEQKASLLSGFWKSEIARLNKEKPMITKISTVNGKTDTIRTDRIDWEKELQLFVKTDIGGNQLANYENVATSDVEVEKGNVRTYIIEYYYSKFENEKIKQLKLVKCDSNLTNIEIVTEQNKELYGSFKELKYNSNGYEIIGSQDVKFLNGIDYKVQVKFNK